MPVSTPTISLEKLLGRRSEIGKLLLDLSEVLGVSVAVENADGKVIFGAAMAQPSLVASDRRFPVELDDKVLGWVTGGERASTFAALLNYAVRQEDEKKSLVSELADRYRELNLLYHLSEHMADSPEFESISEIALSEVQRLTKADSGAILLLDEDRLESAAVFGIAHPFKQKGVLLQRILQSGKAELANDISVEDFIEGEQGYRISILGAPLKTDQRALGVILLVSSQPQAFTAGTLKLLNTIAMQVAPVLEIYRLYQESIEKARFEQELKMARQVQESLLPLHLPQIPGWAIATRWRPAREVAGDFYDVIAENDRSVDLVIADVTDKGMPASLFMAFTRSILRVSIYSGDAPASIITSVNRSICRDSYEGLFTTLVYARLDPKTGRLTYVNAGHNPPLLYHAQNGVIETLGRTGLTLGVEMNTTYSQKTVQMDEGDLLLFYTDGITEATNQAQEEAFGSERLNQQMRRQQDCDVEAVLDSLEAALQAFTQQSQQVDDITLLGLKRIKTVGG